jgi:hemerythrin-like metal-binding protein
MTAKLLGQVLVESGVLTAGRLEEALKKQAEGQKRIGEVLLDLGYVTKDQLVACLRRQVEEYERLIDELVGVEAAPPAKAGLDPEFYEKRRPELIYETRASWSRFKLSTGISIIDIQHVWLIMLSHYGAKIFVAFDPARKAEEILNVFGLLLDYTEQHFAIEEALLKLMDDRSDHIAQHKEFLRFFFMKREKFADGLEAGTANGNVALNEICEFLNGWILSHIAIHDTQYALQLAKSPQRAAVLDKWIAYLKARKLATISKIQRDLYNSVVE